MITIVNKYKHKPTPTDIYIGRGSLLGNPYSCKDNTKALYKVDTIEDVFEEYKKWLKDNFENNLKIRSYILDMKKTANNTDLNLVCFCKPKQCHGDIIKEFIRNLE